MPDERLLTVEQVAERLGANQVTVRRWLKSGRLKGYMPGGTKLGWRIPASEVDRFLEASAPAPAAGIVALQATKGCQ